jgi:hypothetical protein
MGRYVQAFTETAQTYLSTPDVLTSSKDVIISLQSPYDTLATTRAVMGKAFLVINDPKGNNPGVADGDEIKDTYGNLSLSSQKVIIIPQ